LQPKNADSVVFKSRLGNSAQEVSASRFTKLELEYWLAFQEILHLLSVPGMRESITAGMTINAEKCSKELDW
jgi:hypothetical protein